MLEKLKLLISQGTHVWDMIQMWLPIVCTWITGIVAALLPIVQLTPTDKDDNVLIILGKYAQKAMEWLGLPNNKSGGGQHKIEEQKPPQE